MSVSVSYDGNAYRANPSYIEGITSTFLLLLSTDFAFNLRIFPQNFFLIYYQILIEFKLNISVTMYFINSHVTMNFRF